MTERYRMGTIGDVMLPFIIDNSSAKKRNDKITSYHIYETHKKDKCLELVDLLNRYDDDCKIYHEDALKAEKEKEKLLKENEQLKIELTELKASEEDNYNIDDGLW